MVWRDVGDDGYVCLEVVYIVQLEAAELKDIDVVLFGCHLICVALADVSTESYVEASILEKVVDE